MALIHEATWRVSAGPSFVSASATSGPDLLALRIISRRPLWARDRMAAATTSAFAKRRHRLGFRQNSRGVPPFLTPHGERPYLRQRKKTACRDTWEQPVLHSLWINSPDLRGRLCGRTHRPDQRPCGSDD